MPATPPAAALPPGAAKTFFGHPRALIILFFAEMWERFSFYGMRALLILYMTRELAYTDDFAYGVYAGYGALVYAMPVIGGMLADRLLGYRRAIILGGTLMAIGHFVMAVPHTWALYCALGLISMGNGFFKPNISTLVGKLYAEKDPRRDSGFTLFYMGINVGACAGSFICGWIGETYSWHYGFGLAGIGMVAGLIVFARGRPLLLGHGEPPHPAKLSGRVAPGLTWGSVVVLGAFLTAPLLAASLYRHTYLSYALYVVGAAILAYILYTAFRYDRVAGQRLGALVILMFFHTAFWAGFEQSGSSLNLFAERNVDRRLLGWEIPASVFQSVNAGFLILLAPFFSMLWPALEKRGLNPSTPLKFALGLVQVGLGFGVLVLGARETSSNGVVPMVWLVLLYFFHTTGELSISPVGLSTVTKLSPALLVGTIMGAWFLTISFGHNLAGIIANFTKIDKNSAGGLDPADTLGTYTTVYGYLFLGSLAIAAVLLVLSPLIRRMMHGVK